MLVLNDVIVDSSIVSSHLEISGLCHLETCEHVDEEECCELWAVLIMSEYALMIDEVCSEEEYQGFEVNHLRVLNTINNS